MAISAIASWHTSLPYCQVKGFGLKYQCIAEHACQEVPNKVILQWDWPAVPASCKVSKKQWVLATPHPCASFCKDREKCRPRPVFVFQHVGEYGRRAPFGVATSKPKNIHVTGLAASVRAPLGGRPFSELRHGLPEGWRRIALSSLVYHWSIDCACPCPIRRAP